MKRLKISPLQSPVTDAVAIPGSKSYTNRALLLAALTPEPVKLRRPLISDDTEAMIGCLETLGIKITRHSDFLEVTGSVTDIKDQEYELDADLSGTTIRFLLALSAVIPGRQTLRGRPGLEQRPIGDLVNALRQLGADIDYLGAEGYPPLRVNSSQLSGTAVTIGGETSSQYVSALLMIAPVLGTALTIHIKGELFSKPFVAMTVDCMKSFGVEVVSDSTSYRLAAGQTYHNSEYVVEPDISAGSYFAAIAALTSSTLTLQNLPGDSQQADMGFLKILKQMGNKLTRATDAITITGHGVQPVTVDMRDCPDQAQTLAVLAAFADGVTTITGIQSLRIKETERIKALQEELAKMGIKTSATTGSLTIHGGQPRATAIATHGDHRMAMAFAVAGAQLPDMIIKDPGVVTKTFPDFWKQLARVGIKSRAVQPNIVLIGMRGSGKTTVATALAKQLKRKQLDLDAIMAENLGMTTADIVAKRGWDYFRDQEAAIALQLSTTDNTVISTGGGVILRLQNITALKQNGILVLLRASAEVLAGRLGDSYDRPHLTTAKSLDAEVRQVLRERRDLYEAAADLTIDTDGLQPEQVAAQIARQLQEQKL